MTIPLFPPPFDPKTLTPLRPPRDAKGLPGVGRALALYGGLAGQMPLDELRGGHMVEPRPLFLEQPDPELDRPTFIAQSMQDYLWHGNAASLVTARYEDGWPAAVRYFAPWEWNILDDGGPRYYLRGEPVNPFDVAHAQRGVDPMNRYRGVGVLEQHLRSLERAGDQEDYEQGTLKASGVPSVAVIAPQRELSQAELDEAGDKWVERFGGVERRPGIFPHGTEIKTLSWSPSDQQLTLARQLSLTDIANMFNLDPYYVGAPGSSHTYRSAGSMFVGLLRTSLEGVLQPFEAVWSRAWVPHGSTIEFRRAELTRDDMATMVQFGATAVEKRLMTPNEWRHMAGLPPIDDPAADQLLPLTAEAGESEETDSERAAKVARTAQQVYLSVPRVMSASEARELLNRAGADLDVELPESVAANEANDIVIEPAPAEPQEDEPS